MTYPAPHPTFQRLTLRVALPFALAASLVIPACTTDEASAPIGGAGSAGTSSGGGNSGVSGSVGTAGSLASAGSVGTAGTLGSAGSLGVAGSLGTSGSGGAPGTAGSVGTGGTGGAVGTAGAGGSSGSGGAGGTSGGSATIGGVCMLSAATSTLCEAEDAMLLNPTDGGATPGVATDGSGWTGTGFADFHSGNGGVSWTLNAPQAGTYTITFAYAETEVRDMALTVNGTAAAESPLSFNIGSDWNSNWLADVSVAVVLNAGSNTVEIMVNDGGSGPNFDKVAVAHN